MDFELSEEQKQIKELVKDFCKREIDPKRIREIEQKVYNAKTCAEVKAVFPRDLLVKLNDAGLRQLCIPARYGGTAPESGGNVTRALAVEEMAYLTGGAATSTGDAIHDLWRLAVLSNMLPRNRRKGFTQSSWRTRSCGWRGR